MEAIARSRHAIAIAILAGVAISAGWLARLDKRFSAEQIHIATAAMKRHQPELFACDNIFGESQLWRLHAPPVQAAMELVLAPTHYGDPTLPFRLWLPVTVMVYLFGMYALLHHQCGSWSVAVFVAVLSMAVIPTPGNWHWGIGSLASVTPAGFVLALSPLIVLAFLKYQGRWPLLLVFAAVGGLGNLHMVTAMNLTAVLLVAYLGIRHFRPRAWATAFACLLCALAAASPYGFYYLGLHQWLAGTTTSYSTIHESLRYLQLMYPEALKSLLRSDFLLRLAILVFAASIVLSRRRRFRVGSASTWTWFLVASLMTAFGLVAVGRLAEGLPARLPLTVDLLRCLSVIMLPLYVLFAHGLTSLFRLAGRYRGALRWACAASMVAWLLPADNCRVLRHGVYDSYDVLARSLNKLENPPTPRRHTVAKARTAELKAIAGWAKRNSDPKAMFVTDQIEARLHMLRAIVGSRDDDVRYVYYMSPYRLTDWADEVSRQELLLQPPTRRISPESLQQFVGELAVKAQYNSVPQWYAILPANEVPQNLGTLQEKISGNWGWHYRLFRLR